jgi:GMP synthase (glutamine-hydrolysing)
MDKILILDFGSQTTQLIGRRVRDLGVYTEILPGDIPLTGEVLADVRGIILSGSPESVYTPEGAAPDSGLYAAGLPLLGICYGLQRMTFDLGGLVEPLPAWEYGGVGVRVTPPPVEDLAEMSPEDRDRTGRFFAGFDPAVPLETIRTGKAVPAPEGPPLPASAPRPSAPSFSFTAWMSHGDTLTRLAPGFREYGTSVTGFPAVVIHLSRPWFGLQFHPEATHSDRGPEILAAFVFGVCGCSPGWTMEQYVEELRVSLPERVGESPVLLLISGGVDSTVAGALLLKTLPPRDILGIWIPGLCGRTRPKR